MPGAAPVKRCVQPVETREPAAAAVQIMVPILLVLLLAVVLFGAGFAIKLLWWMALAVLVIWLLAS
jgi:membrane protein YdbS with pleckstrin-like domain